MFFDQFHQPEVLVQRKRHLGLGRHFRNGRGARTSSPTTEKRAINRVLLSCSHYVIASITTDYTRVPRGRRRERSSRASAVVFGITPRDRYSARFCTAAGRTIEPRRYASPTARKTLRYVRFSEVRSRSRVFENDFELLMIFYAKRVVNLVDRFTAGPDPVDRSAPDPGKSVRTPRCLPSNVNYHKTNPTLKFCIFFFWFFFHPVKTNNTSE